MEYEDDKPESPWYTSCLRNSQRRRSAVSHACSRCSRHHCSDTQCAGGGHRTAGEAAISREARALGLLERLCRLLTSGPVHTYSAIYQHGAQYRPSTALSQCKEHIPTFQLPSENTRVNYFLDAIETSDSELLASIALVRADKGPAGKRSSTFPTGGRKVPRSRKDRYNRIRWLLSRMA